MSIDPISPQDIRLNNGASTAEGLQYLPTRGDDQQGAMTSKGEKTTRPIHPRTNTFSQPGLDSTRELSV